MAHNRAHTSAKAADVAKLLQVSKQMPDNIHSLTISDVICKQDQILKTKTKVTRPRPRPPEVNKGNWRI